MNIRPTPDRRFFLLSAGALVLGACTSSPDSAATGALASAPESTTEAGTSSLPDSAGSATTSALPTTEALLQPAMFDELPTCILTAPAAEGPFPSAAPLVRREIHENLPGHPLRIGIRVVDRSCVAVPGATVDIWHTDASGDYSEYADNGSGKDEGAGSTFCRGAQTSDEHGILEFLSIYPGWYEGRTVHIHATVRVDNEAVLTTQLYLDEALTAMVHMTGEYAQFGPQDTDWSQDGAIGDPAGEGSLMFTSSAETALGEGTLALINLGIGNA